MKNYLNVQNVTVNMSVYSWRGAVEAGYRMI